MGCQIRKGMVLGMAVPKRIVAVRKVVYDVEPLLGIIAEANGYKWSPGDVVTLDMEEALYDIINDFAEQDLSCGQGHRVDYFDYKLVGENDL